MLFRNVNVKVFNRPPPRCPKGISDSAAAAAPVAREAGNEGDGLPAGPPSLLGPAPMASGKPGDPKSALRRGPL